MAFADREKAVEVAEIAVQMHRDDRLRPLRNGPLDEIRVKRPAVLQDVNEYRCRTKMDDRSNGRDPVRVRQDDFIPGADPERSEAHLKGTRAT